MSDHIFSDLKDIQREMIRLLGEVSTLANNPMSMNQVMDDKWHPKCDVVETESEFIIVIDLPGMEKEDINIVTTDDYIKVFGERVLGFESKNICYYNLEIEAGIFDRKIFFPEVKIDKDNPKVSYKNGFLQIVYTILRSEEKVKRIKIE